MDWKSGLRQIALDHRAACYVPGGWPDGDTITNPRKRKASFDEPVAKRRSPSNLPHSTSSLTSLVIGTPMRFLKYLYSRDNVPQERGHIASTSEDAQPSTTQHELDADTPVPSRENYNDPEHVRHAMTVLQEDRLRPEMTLTQSTLSHGHSSTSDAFSFSYNPSPSKLRYGNMKLSQRASTRDRQQIFDRAALMPTKQLRRDRLPASHRDGHHDQRLDKDYTITTKQSLDEALPERSSRTGNVLRSISEQNLVPIQIRSEGDLLPPSPSLQLNSELEATLPDPNSDSGSDTDAVDIDPSWTVPARYGRIAQEKCKAEGGASVSNDIPVVNGHVGMQSRLSSRLSPPPLSARPIFTPMRSTNAAPDTASSMSKAHQDGSPQLARHDYPPQSGVSVADPSTPSMNGLAGTTSEHSVATPQSLGPAASQSEMLPDSLPITRSAIDLGVARLSIADTEPVGRKTPKAIGHADEKLRRLTRTQLRLKRLEEEALNQYEIIPLSDEWDAKVHQAVRQGHGNYASTDLARAVPEYAGRGQDNWLNDEVINGYLNLVTAHGKKQDRPDQTPSYHAFNSFFYTNLSTKGPESVMRWSKRPKINGTNLLNVKAVFIPINSGVHWTLAVVEPDKKTIVHYNSMRSTALGVTACKHIKRWVAAELGKDFHDEEWTLIAAGESPQQSNSDDCGVFTITSARQIMLGFRPMSYRADQMRVQRKRIVAELVNGALIKSRESTVA